MSVNRVRELERLIDEADLHYYERGDTTVEDSCYDAWVDELRALDHKNLRLTKVGVFDKDSAWPKFSHTVPVSSQNKVNTKDEFSRWFNKYNSPVVVQEKMDGLSLVLYYDENGRLEHGVTRGGTVTGSDTMIGDDVTPNVKKIPNIPQKIDVDHAVIVRVEAYLPRSTFKQRYENANTDEKKKNVRNMAAGVLKRLDGTGCEDLRARTYQLWDGETKHESEVIERLKKLGFDVVFSRLCTTPEEVQEVYDDFVNNRRESLEYDIDGMVVKVDETDENDDPHHPEKQVAYKFEAASAKTTLLDVEWLNSGGHVTPRAVLAPVELMGVTVQHASLSNARLVLRLNLKKGDEVLVVRANDVIPKLVSVTTPNEDGERFVPPVNCLDCGTPLQYEENLNGEESAFIECVNPFCPAKALRAARQWLAAHNVKEVGGAMLEKLYTSGCYKDLSSFLKLNEAPDETLMSVEGMGKSKVKTLKEAVTSTRETTLEKLLLGLDISRLGEGKTTLLLKAAFEHLKRPVSFGDLLMLPLDVISVLKGFSERSVKHLLDELAWVRERVETLPVKVKPFEQVTGGLSGKSFCFTGGLASMTREEASGKVKALGGVLKSGVGRDLDYLVSSRKDTSKAQKAQELGTTVIDEQEFLEMIGM